MHNLGTLLTAGVAAASGNYPMAIGALAGGLGSKVPEQRTDQRFQSGPPAFQLPYIKQLLGDAQNLYQGGQLAGLAGFDPAQLTGQALALQAASGSLPGIASQAQGGLGYLLNPAQLNPATNPFLAATAEGAVRPIFDTLMERVLPSINSGAVGSGQVGSTRQALAQGRAIGDAALSAMDVTANLYNQNYQAAQQRMLGALGLAPQVASLSLLPSQVFQQIGAQRQAQAQAGLDLPFQNIQRYMSLIGQPFGKEGFQTTIAPQPRSNPFLSAIGGALAGQGIYNQFFSNNSSGDK